MSGETVSNFRLFLQQEFELRMARNPRYSLRAFATFLGCPSSRLSEILNGKSLPKAERVVEFCERLGCNKNDTEHWLSSTQRSRRRRKTEVSSKQLEEDTFAAIATWQCFAIMEFLANCESATLDEMSDALGIKKNYIKKSVHSLIGANVVGVNHRDEERYFVKSRNHLFESIGNQPLRELHTQILAKAQSSILCIPVNKRYLQSVFIKLTPEKYRWIIDQVDQLFDDVEAKTQEKSEGEIYSLNVQLHPIKEG